MTVAMLTAVAALAMGGKGSLSVMPLNEEARQLQYKANTLYEKGKFERALFIYKNDLSAVGDKYAQYMVGYMYEKGMGVDADPVAASAWYRIAASGRGRSEFAEAAEDSVLTMSPDEREAADTKYIELRQRYSDVVVVFRQVQKDLAVLNQGNGQLAGHSSMAAGTQKPTSAYDRNMAEKSVSWGLSFLATELEKPAYDDVTWSELDIAALAKDVEAWASELD